MAQMTRAQLAEENASLRHNIELLERQVAQYKAMEQVQAAKVQRNQVHPEIIRFDPAIKGSFHEAMAKAKLMTGRHVLVRSIHA